MSEIEQLKVELAKLTALLEQNPRLKPQGEAVMMESIRPGMKPEEASRIAGAIVRALKGEG